MASSGAAAPGTGRDGSRRRDQKPLASNQPLNQFGDMVTRTLQSLWSTPDAPAENAAKRGPGAAESSGAVDQGAGAKKRPAEQPPMNTEQTEWIQHFVSTAMAASAQAMGTAMEARFQHVEVDVAEVKDSVQTAVDKAEQATSQCDKAMAELVAIKDELKEARDKIGDLEVRVGAGATASPLPPASSPRSENSTPSAPSGQSTPYDQRTLAIMGSLGWDTEADELETRAKGVLTAANIDASRYSGLCAIVGQQGKGSSVQLKFSEPAFLQESRAAIRRLRRVIHGDRMVWLDAKKERPELVPGYMIRKMGQYIKDLETKQEPKLEVTEDVRSRNVRSGESIAGYVIEGKWRWSNFAKNRYDAEALEVGLALANDI